MFSCILNDTLSLRILNQTMANELFEVINNNRDYLREWLPWVDETTSVSHIEEFIAMTLKQYSNNDGFNCGIFSNQEIVGCIGFHNIDWANRKTSIGYWLAGNFQGQGIMTTSCRKLIDYAFVELRLNRVEIKAAVDNVKSRAVPERLGFTQEGIFREVEWVNNRYLDYAVYSMLAREWSTIF